MLICVKSISRFILLKSEIYLTGKNENMCSCVAWSVKNIKCVHVFVVSCYLVGRRICVLLSVTEF